MKKILSFILAFFMIAALFGCSTSNPDDTSNITQPSNSAPITDWVSPTLTKKTNLHNLTFNAPSNWLSVAADSPKGWYYYPNAEDTDGMIFYVACADHDIQAIDEVQDKTIASNILSSVLQDLTDSPYDVSYTMTGNYHTLNAFYMRKMDGKEYEHKFCAILAPKTIYFFIAAEQESLRPEFAASMDDIIATININEPSTDDTDSLDWNVLEQKLATLGAYEIINHTYKEEKDVIVEGVINNITADSFDLWIPYGDSYYEHTDWNYDIPIEGINNGDVVKVCVSAYKDGSLAKSKGILAILKTDKDSVVDIVEEFKKTCPQIDYKGIMRNPDKAYGTLCKATGTVLQVTKTTDTMQEFLLKLSDGNMVYVAYFKEKGSDNILEDDKVTVYGMFYMTETYTTVLGAEKTVPRIPASYVDIH